jgi:hypothetical protein
MPRKFTAKPVVSFDIDQIIITRSKNALTGVLEWRVRSNIRAVLQNDNSILTEIVNIPVNTLDTDLNVVGPVIALRNAVLRLAQDLNEEP